MSLSSPTNDNEHEILMYLRVGQKLENYDDDMMKMQMKSPLTDALNAVSCVPFVQVPIGRVEKVDLTIAGVDAGTVLEPKVDVIMDKSTQSSFGRGSETVLDPSYRTGREIPAADIGLSLSEDNFYNVLRDVKNFMFPGREVHLKLYKLAIYEVGGHFDWHRDSTHSDKHHATLLVALQTSWEGGNLILRRNGIETPVDLRQDHMAVVFYTDTEHRVEPVESGVRIVLQCDVEVEKEKNENENEDNKKNEDADKEGSETDEDEPKEDDLEEEELEPEYEPWTDAVWERNYSLNKVHGIVDATADKAALEKVVSIIKEMHRNGTEEVAFALQHLYRKASILPEYLKGPDATVYKALLDSGYFDISLHPVVLCEGTDWDGVLNEHCVYRYNKVLDDSVAKSQPPKKKQKVNERLFHIPKFSSLVEISKQEYIEHTGNEAMPAKYRYFGGGMFVLPRAK